MVTDVQHPEPKSSSESSERELKMTSAQDVEMPITSNSPSQDSSHPDDQTPNSEVLGCII